MVCAGTQGNSKIDPVFDAHVHIIDPRFPLVENHGYLPEPFTVADYRARIASLKGLSVDGGAVVTASYQGNDQEYLKAALSELGEGWVGVTALPLDATDEDIVALDALGVRAVRFNLRRGATDLRLLADLANRAFDLVGWHAEFYVDATLLLSLEPVFAKLPAVSIDTWECPPADCRISSTSSTAECASKPPGSAAPPSPTSAMCCARSTRSIPLR